MFAFFVAFAAVVDCLPSFFEVFAAELVDLFCFFVVSVVAVEPFWLVLCAVVDVEPFAVVDALSAGILSATIVPLLSDVVVAFANVVSSTFALFPAEHAENKNIMLIVANNTAVILFIFFIFIIHLYPFSLRCMMCQPLHLICRIQARKAVQAQKCLQ